MDHRPPVDTILFNEFDYHDCHQCGVTSGQMKTNQASRLNGPGLLKPLVECGQGYCTPCHKQRRPNAIHLHHGKKIAIQADSTETNNADVVTVCNSCHILLAKDEDGCMTMLRRTVYQMMSKESANMNIDYQSFTNDNDKDVPRQCQVQLRLKTGRFPFE